MNGCCRRPRIRPGRVAGGAAASGKRGGRSTTWICPRRPTTPGKTITGSRHRAAISTKQCSVEKGQVSPAVVIGTNKCHGGLPEVTAGHSRPLSKPFDGVKVRDQGHQMTSSIELPEKKANELAEKAKAIGGDSGSRGEIHGAEMKRRRCSRGSIRVTGLGAANMLSEIFGTRAGELTVRPRDLPDSGGRQSHGAYCRPTCPRLAASRTLRFATSSSRLRPGPHSAV